MRLVSIAKCIAKFIAKYLSKYYKISFTVVKSVILFDNNCNCSFNNYHVGHSRSAKNNIVDPTSGV